MPKGEPVAYNRCEHCNVTLHTNDSGEYYPVVQRMEKHTQIRGTYYPIGNNLHYPRNWGKKKGALLLLESKLEDKIKQLKEAEDEIAKLSACIEKVNEWDETVLN